MACAFSTLRENSGQIFIFGHKEAFVINIGDVVIGWVVLTLLVLK